MPRYLVGACWLISLFLYLGSERIDFPLNPFPKVLSGIFGILVHGYVGAGDAYEGGIILVYATLVGLWLSWGLRRGLNPAIFIGVTVLIHIVLSFLSLPLLMLAGGR